jgi:ribosome-binding factor A
MDSKRQQKFSKLILEEMADIFLRDGKEIFGNAFLTLSGVRVTPDLGVAKIYVALEFIENKTEVLDALNKNAAFFRGHLGKRLRNNMRIIPELRFYEDDTWQEASKMDKMIKDLNIPPETKEEK